jgi:AdoMet-dependent heme synthase
MSAPNGKVDPKPAGLPYLIAVNLTRRCNLSCDHCYLDANARLSPQGDELSTQACLSLFRELGDRAPGTMVVLTGGEPLLRKDILQLVEGGTSSGLRMVLGTNGLLLTEEGIVALKQAGLQGAGISLDDTHPAGHDGFRGMAGAFEKTCAAIRMCAKHGLHAQVHFTVTRRNQDELEDVVSMSKDLGASLVNFFFLVCVGRGAPSMDLTPGEYDTALRRIVRLQYESTGILVQSRCTPHFKRLLYQNDSDSSFTRASGYDGGGCPAGTHYARITPEGDITPCPYMEISAGNIHSQGFWKTWESSTLFQSFRNPNLLQGRCGECEYKLLCGGCRARALAQNGNLMGEDPNCDYQPQGGDCIQPLSDATEFAAVWTEAAKERLKLLPLFIRPMIRKRLEERARREKQPITVEMMQRHRAESQAAYGIGFSSDAEPPGFIKAMLGSMGKLAASREPDSKRNLKPD